MPKKGQRMVEKAVCPVCHKEFEPPANLVAVRYAYNKYCSKHCDYKSRRGVSVPKKNKTIRHALIHDDILCNSKLRPEQKLAMMVLKQAKVDIENLVPQWGSGLTHDLRVALASALKFMFLDRQSLQFWCTIAGWDSEAIQEQCFKLVRGINWKEMLKVHRQWALPSGKEIIR